MTLDHDQAPAPEDLAIGDLVGRLSDDTVRLVRDEIRLAQAEMTQKAKAAGFGLGMFGGAGICAIYGIGVLIAAAIVGLSLVMAVWAAASHRRGRLCSPWLAVRPSSERTSSGGQAPRCQQKRGEHQTRHRRIQARAADMNASDDDDRC